MCGYSGFSVATNVASDEILLDTAALGYSWTTQFVDICEIRILVSWSWHSRHAFSNQANLDWSSTNITLDFDGDNFIGSSDIEHAVKLLTQNELNHDEIESVWEKVRSLKLA
jgi:hypothetical protein